MSCRLIFCTCEENSSDYSSSLGSQDNLQLPTPSSAIRREEHMDCKRVSALIYSHWYLPAPVRLY